MTQFVILSPARADASHPLISELSTGSATSASQEFVELYNPTSQPIDLSNWQLQYKSAAGTATSWTKKATLAGTLPGFGFYLAATKDYIAGADALLTDGMSGTAGHMRLVDKSGTVIDTLGYGSTANAPEASPAPAAGDGHSLERLPGVTNPAGGNSIDTDNNATDFAVRPTPEPQTSAATPEDPSTPAPAINPATTPLSSAPAGDTASGIIITELLPNPASPQTDASDEFIELYNPTDQPQNVGGLVLACGSNFHSKYTLPAASIPAGGYLVYKSSQTKLALTNSGGAARLQTASGTVIYQTPDYDAADDGQSWSYFDDGWDWTITATPGAANIATAAPTSSSKSSASGSTSSSSSKAKTSKATTTTAKAKTAKAATTKTATSGTATADGAAPGSGLSLYLIIGLGALTIGYAIYEYRYRLYNLIRLARSHLGARR